MASSVPGAAARRALVEVSCRPWQGRCSDDSRTLAGVGFAANTTYQLRVVDADGDVIPFSDGTVRSNENGNLGQSLRFNNLPAGTARVSLTTTGGETVASTTFQITAGGAPAATVSALPGEARQGFYVAFTAAGLTPGATCTRAIVAPNGQTAAPSQASFQAEEDGVDIIAISFADTTPAGTYTYRLSGPNGQVLTATVRIVAAQAPTTTTTTSAATTVTATTSAATTTTARTTTTTTTRTTAPSTTTTVRTTTTTTAMPGLPNTGAGGPFGPLTASLIGGAALLALAGLVLALRRRVA